jgi:hypothetical protein
MIESTCTCKNCDDRALATIIESGSAVGAPQPKPQIPGQFKWKPMLAANQYWTYLVTCKICKWDKFSDYPNALDHMWFHYADDCKRPFKKWSN